MNGPIVIGIDPEPGSAAAIVQAARLARAMSSRLIAVRVLELPSDLAMMEGCSVHPVDLHAPYHKQAEAELEQSLGVIGGETEVERRVAEGAVAAELHRVVRDAGGTLLVIGVNRDQSAAGVGVIAAQCVRRASGPVLLVAGRQHRPFERMLACVDFSPVSVEVMRHASEAAGHDRARLTAIHMHHPDRPPAVANPLEDGPDACDNLQGHLRRYWLDHVTGGTPPECVVVQGARADIAIREYVSKHDVDLVVLGTRGRGNLHDRLLGTTAERILRQASVSLLAIPPAATR